jgi:hypothetical protein
MVQIVALQYYSEILYRGKTDGADRIKTFIHYIDPSAEESQQMAKIYQEHLSHMQWDYCNDHTDRPSYVKHVLPVTNKSHVLKFEDLEREIDLLCGAFKAYWNEENPESPCIALWCSISMDEMEPGSSWFLDP